MEKKVWYKQNTTRTAIGGILLAVGGMATGAIDVGTGVQSIFMAVMGIFMRQGVENLK